MAAIVRAQHGHYAPGVSGNPGGKTKGLTFPALVQRYVSAQAVIEKLWSIWDDERNPMADRRWALEQLMDRGLAPKIQAVELAALVAQASPASSLPELGGMSYEQLAALDAALGAAPALSQGDTEQEARMIDVEAK